MQNVSSCCGGNCDIDGGYLVCTLCGKVNRRHLETRCTSYGNLTNFYLVKPYTRKGRFEKKILQLLQCQLNYKLDDKLVKFLRTRKIDSPESLHEGMSQFPTKGRRPYNGIMYYWVALGHMQPKCSDYDRKMLKREFDEIYFAWERLGFLRPSFPYAYLFRKLVNRPNSPYSKDLKFMTRFVRVLRCVKRRERYDTLFEKCFAFNYKNVEYMMATDKKIMYPENEILSRHKVQNPKRMSPYDVPNVYRSMREIEEAKKRGDFDIAKTFHVNKNGQIFMLSYGDPNVQTQKREQISLQSMQVQYGK